jgi:hypothetical protein
MQTACLCLETGEMSGVTETAHNKLRDRVLALEKAVAPPNSWVQRHQVLTWLISLTALLIAFYAGVIPHIEKDDALQIQTQVTDSLKTPLQKLDGMSTDIARINATLTAWAPFMVPTILKNSASMSPDEFNKSLPSLRSAMQIATQAKAIVPTETLQQIALKLRQTGESNPDYWPTVLQFIQFASASFVAPADVPPPNARFSQMSNVTCSGSAHCVVANYCAVILDGGNIPHSMFDHCRIRFTNNPVGLAGTQFIDCVFEMPTDITQPTPYLKNSAKALLASNLRQVMFPS